MAQNDNSSPDRRAILAGAAAWMAAGGARANLPRLPLWALAQQKGILFGASATWDVIRDADYGALHARESRLVVTDTALKYDFLRPQEHVLDFSEADALLDFARNNGMQYRGLPLFWNYLPPNWMKSKSKAQVERLFDEHIEVTVSRYAGHLQSWDVVNEPFWPDHGAPGGFRRGVWFDALGESYIERAWRRVAALDSTAKLVLNEAFTEHDDVLGRQVRALMLPLIDRMLDKGLKLDAIGLQAHLRPQVAFDLDKFLRFIDEIRARKLRIYLTEFDVDDDGLPEDTTRRDEITAQWTTRFLTPVLANPAVEMLVTWQLSDKYTWFRAPEVMNARKSKFAPRPLPFDHDLRPKPMLHAIANALANAPAR
ncbi:MAG: endo-1,4-beta-xylanase [Proteobacteria bacterium]|nr:endo-1,4-beta-xylanase [Pseudomonadota bacterium]